MKALGIDYQRELLALAKLSKVRDDIQSRRSFVNFVCSWTNHISSFQKSSSNSTGGLKMTNPCSLLWNTLPTATWATISLPE